MYKLVYDVVRNWPLFGILPLCLCNSISGCISKTGHLGTNKNLSRPTSSCNSSSFLIHLFVSAPPSTSAEDKTHFGFLLQQHPYFARVLSNFLPGLEFTLVAFFWGTPITTPCDGSTHRLFPCSTGAQQSSPLSWAITHPSVMPCRSSSQPWAECQFSSARSTMTHVPELKSGAHYANLVLSRINTMCIARSEIWAPRWPV